MVIITQKEQEEAAKFFLKKFHLNINRLSTVERLMINDRIHEIAISRKSFRSS